HKDIFECAKRVIALRAAHPVLAREQFYTQDDISWFGPWERPPNWNDPNARAVACLIHDGPAEAVFLMFNASDEPVVFHTPVAPDMGRWRLAVDTSHEEQGTTNESFVHSSQPYTLEPHSSAALVSS